MGIEIRRVTDEDTRAAAFRFRYEVHVGELGKDGHGVDHVHRVLHDEADEEATLFVAEDEGKIVGTARVNAGREGQLPAPYHEWMELGPAVEAVGAERISVTSRLMVDPAYRGRTLASLLVMHLYQHGVQKGLDLDFCIAEPGLLRSYYRLGYRTYRPAIRPAGPGMRVPLALTLRDRQHLTGVSSPFAMLLPAKLDDHGAGAQVMAERYAGFEAEAPRLKGDLRTLWANLADALTRSSRRTLLDGLETAEADRVLGLAAGLRFEEGDLIRARDESHSGLGVVLSGRVGVGLPIEGGWHWLEVLGPGDVFGDPRGGDADRAVDLVCVEPARTALLSENLIEKIAHKDAPLAIRVSSNLIAVLRQRVDDLHRRGAAWVAHERQRLVRERTLPPGLEQGSLH